MTIRPARISDFAHLETFVWQAIFPAFDVPGLTDAQRAENDALVARARPEIVEGLDQPHFAVYVAIEPKTQSLAGYVIANARPGAYAEIQRIMVKLAHRGKGVAGLLLDAATTFIGRDRAVSLAVRHYNGRAIGFFEKHGFINTKEIAGNHAIPRSLMLREANTAAPKDQTAKEPQSFGSDFPSAADEPVFEALPDYTLATDDTPLFATGENALRTEVDDSEELTDTSLTEDQLSVLEAFIAKARAKKQASGTAKAQGGAAKTTDAAPNPKPAEQGQPAFDRNKIAFEVDYGEQPKSGKKTTSEAAKPKPSFAFDFPPVKEEEPPEAVTPPTGKASGVDTSNSKTKTSGGTQTTTPEPSVVPDGPSTKDCPECEQQLPQAARFCYVCGLPQEVPGAPTDEQPVPPEDQLELHVLGDTGTESAATAAEPERKTKAEPKAPPPPVGNISTGDLRKAFKTHLSQKVEAYFGEHMVPKFLTRLETNIAFQQVRDGSLASLSRWLTGKPESSLAAKRKENTYADLTEYFIVETAGDLSGHQLPQRLLRHQSVDWKTADIFKLVMDYLDFDQETETVFTDFVSMPARALKNATRSFLQVAKDERIYFICDQSLIAQGKNGFAITDAGIYWKNVLQPPGAATFTTMQSLRIEEGHIMIDGQFFDAGGRLNLKIAVLLDKLRRMTV